MWSFIMNVLARIPLTHTAMTHYITAMLMFLTSLHILINDTEGILTMRTWRINQTIENISINIGNL